MSEPCRASAKSRRCSSEVETAIDVKELVRGRKGLVVAAMIARNSWRRVAPASVRTDAAGSTHRETDPGEAVDYISAVFEDYLAYGRLGEGDLEGATVLELGPGDSLGVALRFIAAGARRVVCVERYRVWQDPVHQRKIYEELIGRLPREQRSRAESAIEFGGAGISFDPAVIELVEGPGAEGLDGLFDVGSVDLIVSRAVLEYVPEIERSLQQQARLLSDKGVIAHKIDLRDHGLFTSAGHHPLTFLEIPDRLYRAMSTHTGMPNRWRASEYADVLDRLGLDVEVLITHAAGIEAEVVPHAAALSSVRHAQAFELVERTRNGLDPRFRTFDDDDLATAGVFVIARKPGGSR
jgi:SAM-dependent methyltransferase